MPELIGELGAKGTRAAVVITAGVRDELEARDAGGRAAAPAAHPGSQLPGPDAAAHRPQRQLLASPAARRRPRLPVAVGRADHRHHRLGARAQHRLLARRLARRHGRRRFRRPARLSRRRRPEPRHPALHGIGHARAEVHVGGAARGAIQARHRRQGRAQRDGRQGGAVAHGRAGRRRCGLRGRLPARRACCACASSTSSSARPRCWRGTRGSPATGSPSSPTAAAPACSPPTAWATSAARSPPSRDATRAALDAVLPPTWSHGNPVDIIGDADAGRATRARSRSCSSQRGCGRRPGHELPDRARLRAPRSPSRSSPLVDRQQAPSRGRRSRCSPPGSATRRAARRAGCSRRKGIAQLRHAGRGGRRLHAARALLARAGRADAHAAVAAGRLRRRQRRRPTPSSTPRSLPGGAVLSEVEAKELLAAYGIPVVPTEVARDPGGGRGAWPSAIIAEHGACVVKILSDDISHKSDVGGVRLGLERAEEAQQRRSRHAGAHRAAHAQRAHQGLHRAADDPPPARARADPRHVGRSRPSGR